MPVHREPFGVAFVEAMHHALPIVATRLGALRDLVQDDVNGILVAVGDVDALTAALDRLLSDPSCAPRWAIDRARSRAAAIRGRAWPRRSRRRSGRGVSRARPSAIAADRTRCRGQRPARRCDGPRRSAGASRRCATRAPGGWSIRRRGFGSGAVWPSFSTGVSPAKHGRYFYRQVGPESYEAQHFDAERLPREDRSGRQMSDAGRRVAVFDVPKMGLSGHLNGIEVVDWLVHGPVYKELRTHPTSFAADLAARFGTDPLPQCDLPGGRDARQHAELLDVLRRKIAMKGAATRHYLAQEAWDLFVTVFAEPHCVGHQCWHVRDPAHPQHDARAQQALGDPLLEVYRSIDREIGETLKQIDEDTLVIVLSCTGMGPNYSGNLMPRRSAPPARGPQGAARLRRLEPAQAAGQARASHAGAAARPPAQPTTRGARAACGPPAAALLLRAPQRHERRDPRESRGARARGPVSDREEIDAVFATLREDLLALRNLDTGGRSSTTWCAPRTAAKASTWPCCPTSSCSGGATHRSSGSGRRRSARSRCAIAAIALAIIDPTASSLRGGRGVQPGRMEGVSILDFAPTLAALAGVTLARRTEPRSGRYVAHRSRIGYASAHSERAASEPVRRHGT